MYVALVHTIIWGHVMRQNRGKWKADSHWESNPGHLAWAITELWQPDNHQLPQSSIVLHHTLQRYRTSVWLYDQNMWQDILMRECHITRAEFMTTLFTILTNCQKIANFDLTNFTIDPTCASTIAVSATFYGPSIITSNFRYYTSVDTSYGHEIRPMCS